LTFIEALKIFNRYRLLIVAALIMAAMFGYLWSVRQDKVYEASITLLVGQNQGLAENLNYTTALQDVANSMSRMISSRTVADKVIDDYGLDLAADDVLANLAAQPLQQTQLIIVSFKDTDPERAALVANGTGKAFSELISRTESSRSGLTAQVWQEAVKPGAPISPKPVRSGILAGFLGLLGGIALALGLDRVDTRWRTPQQAEEVMGLPILGVIPQMSSSTLNESRKY